ncbi:MAG: hypothetical protein MJZ38_00130 [archaeon]|nr:hypothetical protein [archaeon]
MEIAVYGKGGIGKSTISSNLSYALAMGHRKVIQIGCDPKQDSCRALLKGRHLDSVLDVVRAVPPSGRRLDQMMATGSAGVRCIEAGGPEPGIGCAGKGILTMFQTLERLGLAEVEHDVILYDVLGDVVCGGFAVPMRPDHSDLVLIVTSGEFMSLYAANNIMRGLLNFETDRPRLAGIVFNSRGSPREEVAVEEFSRATGVPVIARIPRSPLFSRAEEGRCTLCEMFPDSCEAGVFSMLAEHLVSVERGLRPCHRPMPLADSQLDQLVSEGCVAGNGEYTSRSPIVGSIRPPSFEAFAPVRRIGMGPVGAALTAGRLMDVPVVIHGSRTCGYSMLNEIREMRLEHLFADPDARVGSGGNRLCTDMRDVDAVFGGAGKLGSILDELARDHGFILVILTCLVNMIGDDVDRAVRDIEVRHPRTRVAVINANEAMNGVDAHMVVLKAIAGLIDTSLTSDGHTVRILDDNFLVTERGRDHEILAELMGPFGKTVGTGFLQDCTLDDVRRLGTSYMFFKAEDTPDNEELARILREKGVRVAKRPLPRGYREGREWVLHMGRMFEQPFVAADVAERMGEVYRSALDEVVPFIRGRRFAIVDDRSESTRWMEEALMDALAGEVVVHVLGKGPVGDHLGAVRQHTNHLEMVRALADDHPDLVVGSPRSIRRIEGITCEPFPTTTLAHRASILFLRRVGNLLRTASEPGWKSWGIE